MTVYRLMKYMDHGIIPQIANKMEKKIRHEVIYISKEFPSKLKNKSI
jgi:hypothetical protein